jgi:sporulation protein YlmC with PRC-barrel domain
MKTIHRRFLVILAPLISSLTIQAESEPSPQEVSESVAKAQRVKADSWRASQIIGTNVKNADDETIGEVKDLVVDLKAGEILAVVVSSGGFLGIGDNLSPVPVAALRYDEDAKAFKTKLTKTQLQDAPNFKNTDWPDYGDPAIIAGLQAYRESLDGRADTRTGRDQSGSDDQRSSDKDSNITRMIRAGINDADLSMSAKNIMIVTNNGEVTLKGTVKNHEEHQEILKIARNHAESSKIKDELRVNE